MTTPLPDTISTRVERLCAEGDDFVAKSRYAAAVMRYATAFRLLPRPQHRWQTTPRILASMVEACFTCGDYPNAEQAALAALECPGVGDNPALRLKLGEIYFEQGDLAAAREQFQFALQRAGEDVFADEDPKYWAFATSESSGGADASSGSGDPLDN